MKKTITFLFALFFATSLAFSQAVEEGSKLINLDIGLIPTFAHGKTRVPPITASFDYLIKKIGPGTIGVGGLAGFASTRENLIVFPSGVADPNTYFTYSYFLLGLRGTYHWFPGHSDKVDTYGGVIIGYKIVSHKYTGFEGQTVTPWGSGMLGGIFAGIRYFPSEKFGISAEVGYGVALLNIGGTFKF